jgi:hypothetical protein
MTALNPHPEELARASVPKDEAEIGASWFETALARLLTMRNYDRRGYCETVCTTDETGRVLTTGTFESFSSASSYCGRVCIVVLAFICTTL